MSEKTYVAIELLRFDAGSVEHVFRFVVEADDGAAACAMESLTERKSDDEPMSIWIGNSLLYIPRHIANSVVTVLRPAVAGE